MSRWFRVYLCPECDDPVGKVIYAGLPMLYCPECDRISGFWHWVPKLCPMLDEDGDLTLMLYEGSYLRGLIQWMFGSPDDWTTL